MNEITWGAFTHLAEGFVIAIIAWSLDYFCAQAGFHHDVGFGRFQGVLMIYGLLKMTYGIWIWKEWDD